MFKDRKEAGQLLAHKVSSYKDHKQAIILALPRGGVVIGNEIAKALHLPLDVICPRKIGAPFNPELAIGAITETGHGIFNDALIAQLGISKAFLEETVEKEKQQALSRRMRGPFCPHYNDMLGQYSPRDAGESRVEGFKTTATRRRRPGCMNRVHRPAMIRSAARRLGARFRPRLRMHS